MTTPSITSEQLETLAAQLEAIGQTAAAVSYRQQATALRQLHTAPASSQTAQTPAGATTGPDGYIILDDIDGAKLEQGWGSSWHRPAEVPSGLIPGETEGVIWPSGQYVKGKQIWLVFRSTDGNYYRDRIAIAWQTSAVGKLGDILRELGIPYLVENRQVKFQFPPGLPCQLLFQPQEVPQASGPARKEIQLVEVKAVAGAESL